MGLAYNFIDLDTHTQADICMYVCMWLGLATLAICQRAHNHSLQLATAAVKFIACPLQSRKSFLTCPMAQICVCVCYVVSLSCLCHLLILYSNFRLMHMTLIRLHPVEEVSTCAPPPRLSLSYISVFFFLFFGWHAFKALYLFTPLSPWLPWWALCACFLLNFAPVCRLLHLSTCL